MRSFVATLSVIGRFALPNTSLIEVDARSGTHLIRAQAQARLVPNHITASSSDSCATKSAPPTPASSRAPSTVSSPSKIASGVSSLVITGGTEVGHAGCTYSHANGYKVDVRHSTLDNYIHSAPTRIANRGVC